MLRRSAFLLAGSLLAPGLARAQSGSPAGSPPGSAAVPSGYPDKPVRIIVPSAPGGGTDIVARVLAERLSQAFNRQFVVENRAGAGQMIGIEAVARAPADGYTLLLAASTLVLNGLMFRNVSYDPVRDFAPVTQIAVLPNVLLVHPAVPVRTVAELIALARARPGELNYSSAGIGTSPHMSMELFKSMAGISMEHVAYRGTAPAMTDLLGGRVSATMANVLTARPAIEAGTARPLGVTGTTRVPSLPDIPTVAEAGLPGYAAPQWYGLLAPAGTPRPIVERLQAEAARALAAPDLRDRLAADGAEPVGNAPDEFAAQIRAEIVKWTQVAQAAGIQPE
ncbi:tripartite tricarboxylate transporter substrate binding protein [Roseomonas sp. BN140053]|uniref:tripartite tricarboxylate transporter substrate binding protein n=1 Tax=Roseomonas sp. BN140053 TaxID=3391898 RepID=UPI0039E8DD3A